MPESAGYPPRDVAEGRRETGEGQEKEWSNRCEEGRQAFKALRHRECFLRLLNLAFNTYPRYPALPVNILRPDR